MRETYFITCSTSGAVSRGVFNAFASGTFVPIGPLLVPAMKEKLVLCPSGLSRHGTFFIFPCKQNNVIDAARVHRKMLLAQI